MGHSPEVRLSLLDLNHVSSLKGMVIRGGGAIQCQNNYLQAMWTQVSNRYISLRGTFMVRIILEYKTFGIASFQIPSVQVFYKYQYKGIEEMWQGVQTRPLDL